MIIYEFPLNEHIRTLLKLERLFQQALQLIRLDDSLSHQTALFTLFNLIEIASRNEIKTDLQMELARLRQHCAPQPEPESTEFSVQDDFLRQTDLALAALHALPGKIDQALREHEWLNAVRQRINIPGGINGFDLPYFHYWQNSPTTHRRSDLVNWIAPMLPIYNALIMVLKHLRTSRLPQSLIASQGFHQQILNGRSGQMLRIGLAANAAIIPETSASRHAINIRFLSLHDNLHTRISHDIEFQLCFCAL